MAKYAPETTQKTAHLSSFLGKQKQHKDCKVKVPTDNKRGSLTICKIVQVYENQTQQMPTHEVKRARGLKQRPNGDTLDGPRVYSSRPFLEPSFISDTSSQWMKV